MISIHFYFLKIFKHYFHYFSTTQNKLLRIQLMSLEFFNTELERFLSIQDVCRLMLISKRFHSIWKRQRNIAITRIPIFQNLISKERFDIILWIYEDNLQSRIDPNFAIFDNHRASEMFGWPKFWHELMEQTGTRAPYKDRDHQDVTWLLKVREFHPLVCRSVKNEKLFRFLVNDSRTNVRTHEDDAFQLACQRGHTDAVKILLEKGAEPSLFSNFALRVSCDENHWEIVELILNSPKFKFDAVDEKLADFNSEFNELKHWKGLLIWLLQKEHFGLVKRFWDQEFSKYNVVDLFESVFKDQSNSTTTTEPMSNIDEMIEFVLKKIGNVNIALEIAIKSSNAKWVQRLLTEFGANPAARGDDFLLAMHKFYNLNTIGTSAKQETFRILISDERFDVSFHNCSMLIFFCKQLNVVELLLEIPRIRTILSQQSFLIQLMRSQVYLTSQIDSCVCVLNSLSEVELCANGNEILIAASQNDVALVLRILQQERCKVTKDEGELILQNLRYVIFQSKSNWISVYLEELLQRVEDLIKEKVIVKASNYN